MMAIPSLNMMILPCVSGDRASGARRALLLGHGSPPLERGDLLAAEADRRVAQVDGVKEEEERLDRERSGMAGLGAVLVSGPSHTSRSREIEVPPICRFPQPPKFKIVLRIQSYSNIPFNTVSSWPALK